MNYTSTREQTIYTLPNISQASQYTDLKVSTKYETQQGIPGRAATIQVGNVSVGYPTSVTNVGTENAAIFDFVIEKGPQGETGPQGPQGAKGDTGAGVPAGGIEGQVLVKKSSTDYDTAWITPPYDLQKEQGSKVIIRLTNESSHIDSKTMRMKFGQRSSYGQLIDWGDGTAPEEMTTIMEHTFPDYGFYELTIYAKEWFDHYLYIDRIYGWNPETESEIGHSHATIQEAKVSYYCMGVSLDVKSGTFKGCDLSAWTSQTISYGRKLGRFFTYQTMTGTLELPWAGIYDCHIDYAPQLESIIFPGCSSYNSTYTWQNVFKEPTSSNAFQRLKRIELKAVVPPLIHATEYGFWLPNVPVIVPWSPDHSILNAYKAATGWSTYASQITEETNVPAGGLTGQVLVKTSSTDYDTKWSYITTPPDDSYTQLWVIIGADNTEVSLSVGNRGAWYAADFTDWGDGNTSNESGGTHTYAKAGRYMILIGTTPDNPTGSAYDVFLSATSGTNWSIYHIKPGTECNGYKGRLPSYSSCDFYNWSNNTFRQVPTTRFLGSLFPSFTSTDRDEWKAPLIGFLGNDMESMHETVILPNSLSYIHQYALMRQSVSSSNIKKLILNSTTPPSIKTTDEEWSGTTNTLNLPNGCMILVPWSADHSIYNSYVSAWSGNASQIYEQPGPTQPV